MKNFSLDIVIPVGNVFRDFSNLEEILESSQDSLNHFILVIDDPSPSSLAKASTLAKPGHERKIHFVHSKEANPGGARNLGLKSAINEWTHFCDSDDSTNLIEISKLVSSPTSSSTDIVIGSFATFEVNSQCVTKFEFGRSNLSNLLMLAKHPGIWRWVFRRSFIGNTQFPSSSMGEDQLFIIQLLLQNPRIRFSEKIIYTHVTGNSHSLVGSKANICDLGEILEQILLLKITLSRYVGLIFLMSLRMSISLMKYGSITEKGKGLSLQLRLIHKFIGIITIGIFRRCFIASRAK
jgi:glycosyltransferase involved in cell wall biosynthesis